MRYGSFVWYELATTDLAAAEQFYGDVTGSWTFGSFDMPGEEYRVVKVGERAIGGFVRIAPGTQGPGPLWRGYIDVDDVEAMAARVKTAGGAVHYGPEDIANSGTFAVCSDPSGAQFMIFKGLAGQQPQIPLETPGAVGWHELYTDDLDASWSFYSSLFGWTKSRSADLGLAGTYQVFGINGVDVGAMLSAPSKPSSWLFYVTVDDIDTAAKRIASRGAVIRGCSMDTPDAALMVQARDLQGAVFAVRSSSRRVT